MAGRGSTLFSSDLEACGYAVGAANLCAASVGAPHIRQRLWFVGVLGDIQDSNGRRSTSSENKRRGSPKARRSSRADGAIHPVSTGLERYTEHENRSNERGRIEKEKDRSVASTSCCASDMAFSNSVDEGVRDLQRGGGFVQLETNPTAGFWSDAEWIYCRDDRWRPVEPGTFPLAYGVTNRMGLLRAFGNSIVPQVAATFIEAVMDFLISQREV